MNLPALAITRPTAASRPLSGRDTVYRLAAEKEPDRNTGPLVFQALGGPAGLESEPDISRLRRTMAGAGHDLMQPLQVVSHALERLSRHAADDRDKLWSEAAACQIARMSEGLSALIQASLKTAEFGTRHTGMAALLDGLEADWSLPAQLAGIELTVVRSSCLVTTAPCRLRSVLDNLVANAIKYSPSGRVLIGCRRRQGRVSIDVIDNGPGITIEDQARIFRAFCQLNPDSHGVGLGLSLVREECASLGHQLELQSVPGRGTRFSVLLASAETQSRCG